MIVDNFERPRLFDAFLTRHSLPDKQYPFHLPILYAEQFSPLQ